MRAEPTGRSGGDSRTPITCNEGDGRARGAGPERLPDRTHRGAGHAGGRVTIDRPGYYRVDVAPDRTWFVARRGGIATMTPAGGQADSIATSERVVVPGSRHNPVQTFVAPELDGGIAGTTTAPKPSSPGERRYVRRVTGVDDSTSTATGAWCRSTARCGLAKRRDGLGPLHHRPLGLGSALRVELGGHGALGLGALSLRPLGASRPRLGLGARTRDRAPGLRPGARGLLRRAGHPRLHRRALRELGRARLG